MYSATQGYHLDGLTVLPKQSIVWVLALWRGDGLNCPEVLVDMRTRTLRAVRFFPTTKKLLFPSPDQGSGGGTGAAFSEEGQLFWLGLYQF